MADNDYTKRIGDRREGRQLRSLDAGDRLSAHIRQNRSSATVNFRDSIECTEIERYLRNRQNNGHPSISTQHVFLAAYVRVVTQIPGLNRFVAGGRIYSRFGIDALVTMRRAIAEGMTPGTVRLALTHSDTIFDIEEKMLSGIDAARAGESDELLDQFSSSLLRLPSPVVKFTVWALRVLDYLDWLPGSLLNNSPYHGSINITDYGPQGTPPLSRGLDDFGNIPLSLQIGARRREAKLDERGNPMLVRYIDYEIALDDRICSGYLLTSAIKYFRYYLANPHLLENPPETITEDVL